jgi:hypothetical protein
MPDRRPTLRLAAVFLIPAIALAACGGAASSPGSNASGAAPSSGIVPPSGLTLPSDGSLPSFAIPSFDLSGLITNLDNVDSYKVAIVASNDTSYTGTVITKPVVSRDLLIGTGTDATHIVTIGDEAWMGTGDGPLQSAPNALIAGMIPLFDPAVLLSVFANESLLAYADNLGEENKNGQPTTHYKVDVSKLPNFAALGMPATATIEMWVADDGYLVSFIATDFGQAGSNLAIDITNVNDPANVVAHP